MGMCGMLGDVNGDIPVALTPWTTAENDRFKRRGGEEEKKKRGRREERRRDKRSKAEKRRRWEKNLKK